MTAKEIESLSHLLRRRKLKNRDGNYLVHFTEASTGRNLLRKMQAAGWIDWTGYMGMFFDRPCYVLNRRGVREVNKLVRASR